MSRLVVASNRVAIPQGARPAPGGLAVGLLGALGESGGIWFGWNGKVTETTPDRPEVVERNGVEFATLPLGEEDYEDYYRGFANRVLWPLFHGRLHLLEFRRRYFEGYRRVNTRLADILVRRLRPGDFVWVHDFHLIPMGDELRADGAAHPLGFFLHTPFPPYDVLRALPGYARFLRWLAAYDLVGFQTALDRSNFLHALRQEFGVRPDGSGRIRLGNRCFAAGVYPIGIDVEQTVTEARRGQSARQGRRLQERRDGRQLIMGADRLDYSKGLVERFRAYGELLKRYPGYRGRVIFMQIAQPSRSDVPEYQEIRHQLDMVAGEINGTYSEFDWVPIRYISRSFARPNVLGFLAAAQVGFVTPLRDGMNLVAKEFVAAQDPEDPGVLVLSELAGAARELDAALLINPYDVDGMANALDQALSMALAERQERWSAMMDVLRRNDIHAWRRNFLEALVEAHAGARAALAG